MLGVAHMKEIVGWAGAGFALAAAILWFSASHQKVDHDPNETDEQGAYPFAITERVGKRTIDIMKTAASQTKLNGWAALAAAVAAALQTILLILSR
jgi:hypothetical protein